MEVHNHGTEEGKGLACRESKIGGRLVGQCMNVTSMEAWIERKTLEPSKPEIYKRIEEIDMEIMLLQTERAMLENQI